MSIRCRVGGGKLTFQYLHLLLHEMGRGRRATSCFDHLYGNPNFHRRHSVSESPHSSQQRRAHLVEGCRLDFPCNRAESHYMRVLVESSVVRVDMDDHYLAISCQYRHEPEAFYSLLDLDQQRSPGTFPSTLNVERGQWLASSFPACSCPSVALDSLVGSPYTVPRSSQKISFGYAAC